MHATPMPPSNRARSMAGAAGSRSATRHHVATAVTAAAIPSATRGRF
jgi:hypothetical protein